MQLPSVLTTAPGIRAAELLIDGLSVFCFNQMTEEHFWEVAFPRLAQHQLGITIQELNAAGDPVGNLQTFPVADNLRSLNIRLTNGSIQHFDATHFPSGGPRAQGFNRTDRTINPNDLGWMVDLNGQELDHGTAKLLPGHASRPISLARIHHSLFCTQEPDEHEVRISPIFDGDPLSANSSTLHFTNTEIVGVLLGTFSGDIVFEADPLTALNIGALPYSPETRYEITITNTDLIRPPAVGSFSRGDLFRFYHVLIDVNGVEKDLWAQPRTGPFFPDGDCHSTIASFPTLESAIQP